MQTIPFPSAPCPSAPLAFSNPIPLHHHHRLFKIPLVSPSPLPSSPSLIVLHATSSAPCIVPAQRHRPVPSTLHLPPHIKAIFPLVVYPPLVTHSPITPLRENHPRYSHSPIVRNLLVRRTSLSAYPLQHSSRAPARELVPVINRWNKPRPIPGRDCHTPRQD